MALFYQKLNSPLGSIYIATDGDHLRVLAIDGDNWTRLKNRFSEVLEREHPVLSCTKQQLDEYFLRQRVIFDLPLYFEGTAFQVAVWNALLEIPYGETRSYSEQAEMVKNPKAVRAIGRTNGLNPISIVVPCHRVIGKSGQLTGYASGLSHKKYLLDLESKYSG